MRHTQNIRKTFARLEYTNKDMHKDTDKKLILWRFVYKNNVFSWETEKGKPSVTHSTIFLLLLRRFKKKTMSIKNTIKKIFQGKLPIALRNLAAAGAVFLLLDAACHLNPAYDWVWNVYIQANLREVSSLPHASLDERLTMKLGEDYQYVIFVRDATPSNSVIFYPSLADFTTVLPGNEKSPFSGKLTDKLSAIRILYPRHIVLEDEMGRTPWSFKITNVAIVNRRNVDKLPYQVPSHYYIGVLPTDSTMVNY